jgi:hypothetical protein
LSWCAAVLCKFNVRVLTLSAVLTNLLTISHGQDLNYARQQVKTLTSPEFHGRGYVLKGDDIAAKYLANEFSKFRLRNFGSDYYQHYSFPVNTFPGNMDVWVDEQKLVPGVDFLMYPPSAGIRGNFDVEVLDSTLFQQNFKIMDFVKRDFSYKFIMLDTIGWSKDKIRKQTFDLVFMNMINAAGVMLITDNTLVHSVAQHNLSYCLLIVKRNAVKKYPKHIKLKVRSKYLLHKASNIIGFIPGKTDTFLVITAHYDHLGMMGEKTYFPGANDNASGTAMLLNFARSFSSTSVEPRYSIAFMLFSGEEAGLLGSAYYTENPLFPLNKIKLLVNLDMVGGGSGGVNVYNGNVYPDKFRKLDSLNRSLSLNLPLKSRGVSKGSDHYLFHVKKVPILYFSTEAKELSYHATGDNYEALPFTVYEKLFKLIDAYLKTL